MLFNIDICAYNANQAGSTKNHIWKQAGKVRIVQHGEEKADVINVYKCAPEGGKLFSQVSHDRKKSMATIWNTRNNI